MWIKKSEYAELVRKSREADRFWHERMKVEERAFGHMKQLIDLRSQNDSLHQKVSELQREITHLRNEYVYRPFLKSSLDASLAKQKLMLEISLKSIES
jgi:hypothetical protein